MRAYHHAHYYGTPGMYFQGTLRESTEFRDRGINSRRQRPLAGLFGRPCALTILILGLEYRPPGPDDLLGRHLAACARQLI